MYLNAIVDAWPRYDSGAFRSSNVNVGVGNTERVWLVGTKPPNKDSLASASTLSLKVIFEKNASAGEKFAPKSTNLLNGQTKAFESSAAGTVQVGQSWRKWLLNQLINGAEMCAAKKTKKNVKQVEALRGRCGGFFWGNESGSEVKQKQWQDLGQRPNLSAR